MTDLLSELPSPLDAAIGLVATELLADAVVLRLDPPACALGGEQPRPFLHGGTLATCVDTAGWYAGRSHSAESMRENSYRVVGLRPVSSKKLQASPRFDRIQCA